MSFTTRLLSRQWLLVSALSAGLAAGAAALVRFGPDVEVVGVGSMAPDYRVYDLARGDSVSLRERYKGSVTLVNIWLTSCVPCRVEMPAMQRMYDSLSRRGLRIAAVSVDIGSPLTVRNFARQYQLTFDILQDQEGGIQQAYQTTGVPESFLLNRQGIIVKRVIGAQDWNSPVNRALAARLLDEPGSP